MADSVRPIRVLFFVAEFFRLQGSQRSLLALLKRLPRESVEPIVVFPGEGRCTEAYREAGLDVRVLQAPEDLNVAGKALLHLSPLRAVRVFFTKVVGYNRRLARLADELKADVFHFNTARSILLAGLSAALTGKPRVLHVRGQVHVLGRLHRFISLLLPSRIILVSESLRSQIPFYFQDKCQTIYTGIDERDIPGAESHATAQAPRSNGHPLVCTFGAVCPFKGYHHLIEASHIINLRGGPVPTFLAVGEVVDETYHRYLEALLRKYALTDFHFLGWQDNVLGLYESADVVVLPSVEEETLNTGEADIEVKGNEGLPRAVLEAMCLGKAVVATRVAGTVEQIEDGVNGLLVEPGNADELAQAIKRLVDDPVLRDRMGRSAALRVRDLFSKEKMVADTVALFRGLAG
jgi:glycosyltransferase involved in cell wall biosynthesis